MKEIKSILIKYKGIQHNRVEDAPFIGALIVAPTCSNNCKGCFNQHLKDIDGIEDTSENIIQEVLDNKFNQGIILAGLEWCDTPNHMLELVYEAQQNNLNVMIYTSLVENEFRSRFPEIKDVYVKLGKYDDKLICNDNIQYGIKLATSNQKIIKL